jgi:hypothetical protein
MSDDWASMSEAAPSALEARCATGFYACALIVRSKCAGVTTFTRARRENCHVLHVPATTAALFCTFCAKLIRTCVRLLRYFQACSVQACSACD